MLVAALSLAGIDMSSGKTYREGLLTLLQECGARVAVLPAYSSLYFGIRTGLIPSAKRDAFSASERCNTFDENGFNGFFLDLHRSLAQDLDIYLCAGTVLEKSEEVLYHRAYCFDPSGEVVAAQRQTHLTRAQREAGWGRGDSLDLFDLDGFPAGIIVGNDVRHPETGRIFGLQGAAIVLHCGALEAGLTCWLQAAGMWAQVQQNQFWAVEAQLCGQVNNRRYSASSAVLGPTETTCDGSGYLARGYPGSPVVAAKLEEKCRLKIRLDYPLLELLNPDAYYDLKWAP